MLNILLNGSEIIAFIKCKILVGIPLGPEHLLIFRSNINSPISILSQVPKTNELGSELERYHQMVYLHMDIMHCISFLTEDHLLWMKSMY